MDFGTTNSGIAIYDGRQVQLLPLDPANTSPQVVRTALYITNDQKVAIGREAVNRYFDENVGRPVKMKKVWVGEVEVYGADMYYVTDVYAWVDMLSPGRLFLSIKSGLRDPEYQGTVVGQFYYSLENLIALYMSLAKIRAEQLLGREVHQVVLGRPIRFSTDSTADNLAEQRLLEAAFRAGFEKVYLQYEPVAAAYHYAASVEKSQNILIFDFGGGTLDITVMHVDEHNGREVLATDGIPVAGDIFDKKLVRAKLPKHFGEGTLYGPENRRLPLPKWIYDVFSDWQTIIELQTPESRKLLREIAQTADDRPGIEALTSLVANNYGLQMFDVLEAAKRKLSDDMATVIRLEGPTFDVTELLTRSEFEKIIQVEIQAIEKHLDETLTASGLDPKEIDAVIRTGGSSNIPAFRYMLMEKFGRNKVLAADTFSSVTSGLGIIAHGIDRGAIEVKAHTPASRRRSSQTTASTNVASVNLSLLQRRLAAPGDAEGSHGPQSFNLISLNGDGKLIATSINKKRLLDARALDLSGDWVRQSPSSEHSISLVKHDELLLLVTSRYRFFLATAGHLSDMNEMGIEVADFFQLREDEHVSAINCWASIKEQAKLLLVTTRGYARSYNLAGLIEQIKGPTPLQFDQPLPGLPLNVHGSTPEEELVVIMDNGRAVRYPVSDLPLQGLQVINRYDDEGLVGSQLVRGDDQLILVTAGGFGRRLPAEDIPIPPKPNSRGRVIITRRPVAGFARVAAQTQLWAFTSTRLVQFSAGSLPLDTTGSTRSHSLLQLSTGEFVTGVFAG